jgi:hypothetical protein
MLLCQRLKLYSLENSKGHIRQRKHGKNTCKEIKRYTRRKERIGRRNGKKESERKNKAEEKEAY